MTPRVHDGGERGAAQLVRLAPVVLVVIAEASWISVVGGLVQEFALRQPELGIPQLAVVVAGGIALARLLGPRAGRRWPAVALALVVLAALLGWLVSGDARASLDGGIGPALAAHPGGLLAGLALLRGFAHARLPLAESTLTHLLAVGVPGLAVLALVGGVIGDPYRGRFLADALVAAIVFVSATVLALAFARLGAIGHDDGLDWNRNPVWLGLTVALLGAAVVAALSLAGVVGPLIALVLSLALGPMLVAGFVTGLDRTGRRILAFFAVLCGIVYLRSLFGGSSFTVPLAPAPPQTEPSNTAADQVMSVGIGALLVIAAIAAVLVLAAVWMRRARLDEDDDVLETRTVDRGGEPEPRRRRWPFRRQQPRTAVEAYVALLADLERSPVVRRRPGETPAEHAARIRAGGAELSLDLLAADYALARDAGSELSAREDARAIDRWRVLRRRLVRRPPPPEARDAARDMPVDDEPQPGARMGIRTG